MKIWSRYLLFKSADKWTERQKQRAAILFEEYPDIKKAYGLCHSLRMIFAKNTIMPQELRDETLKRLPEDIREGYELLCFMIAKMI